MYEGTYEDVSRETPETEAMFAEASQNLDKMSEKVKEHQAKEQGEDLWEDIPQEQLCTLQTVNNLFKPVESIYSSILESMETVATKKNTERAEGRAEEMIKGKGKGKEKEEKEEKE
jgi:hypothetical protein